VEQDIDRCIKVKYFNLEGSAEYELRAEKCVSTLSRHLLNVI